MQNELIPDRGNTPNYSIIVPDETKARAAEYLQSLRVDPTQAGAYLGDRLSSADIGSITELDLLGCLFDTKKPRFYAESEVRGNGFDWNLTELGLLGDVSVAVPVTIFDNGNHKAPAPHKSPLSGVLIFTPGALLCNGKNLTPADWNEVTTADRELSPDGYYNLYRRRLLPVLRYVNEHAGKPRSALLTIPGLGCGMFAGDFIGQLGAQLQSVLEKLLNECGDSLPNLKAVYFDPYNECTSYRSEIHGVSYMVRPLMNGHQGNSQLCPPSDYAEQSDDFSACSLYSIVAWDHVSWPGNDFYAGSRATDDGVKAAATNSMAVLTGVEGNYDPVKGKYQPPPPYRLWKDVVEDRMKTYELRLWNPLAIWRPVGAK